MKGYQSLITKGRKRKMKRRKNKLTVETVYRVKGMVGIFNSKKEAEEAIKKKELEEKILKVLLSSSIDADPDDYEIALSKVPLVIIENWDALYGIMEEEPIHLKCVK